MPRKKAPPRRNGEAAEIAAKRERAAEESARDVAKRARARASFGRPARESADCEILGDDDAADPGFFDLTTLSGRETRGGRVASGASASASSPPATRVRFESAKNGDVLRWRLASTTREDDGEDATDDDDDASAAFATDIPNGPATTRAFLDLVAGGFLAARVLPSQGGGGAGRAIGLVLTPTALQDEATHPEACSRRAKHASLRTTLAWLTPPTTPRDVLAAGLAAEAGDAGEEDGTSTDAASKSLLREIYDAAKPPSDAPTLRGDFSSRLAPPPRPYQRRAVDWMIRREKGGVGAMSKRGGAQDADADADGGGDDDALHPLWSRLLGGHRGGHRGDDGVRLYVNWHTGQLSRTRFPAPEDVRGGILADEMGLGKTVEVLLCVLAHPYVPPAAEDAATKKTAAAKEEEEKRPPDDGVKAEAADARVDVEDGPMMQRGEKDDDAVMRVDEDEDDDDDQSRARCPCCELLDPLFVPPRDGVWLACETCDDWYHARCVGYTKTDERRHAKATRDARRVLADARRAAEEAETSKDAAAAAAAAAAVTAAEADVVAADDAMPFTCGACVAKRAGEIVSGPCGATLVVCPAPILNQWRSELARHAVPGAVRVVVYEGQPRDAGGPSSGTVKKKRGKKTSSATSAGFEPAQVTSAKDLAAADVVLTTYDVLRNDLHHDPSGDAAGAARASRYAKRYSIVPTPLTRLTWWRVVLDEAQEVESSTAAAAAMARQLVATHRWAVSGTPASRGLEDLRGLFSFLGAPSPLADATWWRRCVQTPHDAKSRVAKAQLARLLRRVMWRNGREDVKDELLLPPQGQTITWLRPSGIEAHWYRQQKKVCERAARDALRRIRGTPKTATAETDAMDEEDAERARRASAPAWAAAAGAGRILGGGDGAFEDVADLIENGGEEEEEKEEEDDDDDDDAPLDAAPPPVVDLTGADDDRYLTTEESRRVLAPLLRLRQACNHPQAGTHGVRGVVGGPGGPNAAGASVGAGGIHHGVIMTMPQIHEVLIERQRVEAEEAQRLVAFTLNASAGVAMCRREFAVAVKHYREVLRLAGSGSAAAEDGSLCLRLDALQRLHALHNLREALDAAVADGVGVSRTVADDALFADAETERQKYIAQRAGGLAAASREVDKSRAAISLARARCGATGTGTGPSGATWWLGVLDGGKTSVDRLLDGVLRGMWQGREAPFRDVSGLRYTLESDLERMGEERERFTARVEHLARVTSEANPEDVAAAGKCPECKTKNIFDDAGEAVGSRFVGRNRTANANANANANAPRGGSWCQHCRSKVVFEAYENVLFAAQGVDRDMRFGGAGFGRSGGATDVGAGKSAPSSAETVLKHLASRIPKIGLANAAAAEAAAAHLEMLEEMRKEFTRAMTLTRKQREELYARDELAMATTRIRVRAEHEVALGGLPDPVPEHLRDSVVHEWELDGKDTTYAMDRVTYEADLRRASAQTRFLERLRHEDEDDAEKAFECPVCHEDVDTSAAAASVAVLPCGHRQCVRCTDALVDRAPPPPPRHPKCFKCPTCRARVPSDEINYVSAGASRVRYERWPAAGASANDDVMDAQLGTEREQLEGEASKVVRGSWGTKVEAVARRVLWLLDDARPGADADARALVFSEWEDALRVVAAALRANGVDVEHPAGGGKKLRDAIERFKAAPALSASSASPPPRVLLMPLRRGANGLNLTEAQHVILLEPVLDPGAEAQAMKRVDRIGQTKPTCVHRFLLSGTVEENVHELSRRRREAAVGDGGGDVGRGRGGAGSGMKLSEVDVLVPPA
jgi:E3 ubiquitin-protein ligase SHPRH